MEAKQSGRSSSPQSKSSLSDSKADSRSSSSSSSALPPFPLVTVTSVDCQPDVDSPLTSGLSLELDFTLSFSVPLASWSVSYVVDSMRNRHIIVLGSTEPQSYEEGPSSMYFSVPAIDVSAVGHGALTNAGLLSATMRDGEGNERFTINLVVQVQERGGEIRRTIFNPME